jgi:hypothetical protein
MEDNGDIAMPSIDRHEVAWLSVDVAHLRRERRCRYETPVSYASPPENPMAGLTLAYGPLLVDRRESRPILGDGQ